MTHLPSHFSQRRPMAIPASLRHITRSGWCFAISTQRWTSHAAEPAGVGGLAKRAHSDDSCPLATPMPPRLRPVR